MWPFKSRIKTSANEVAAVNFADRHYICDVHRDADDRPYVVICDRFVRLDSQNPAEADYRDVVWLKRRAPSTEEGSL